MATKQANDLIRVLKERGLRVTPQRYSVYANLLGRTDHPTVDQILVDLNQDYPVSSQATVYSSLQALRNVHLVREVLLEEGVSRYDANVTPHHHFRCKGCGEIEDIPWNAFDNLGGQKLRPGLQVDRYEVTVHGMCDRCHPDS
ncbi:MAG: Fur family transcriptional regulator [Thermosynechococcaceae cyanobacterium]